MRSRAVHRVGRQRITLSGKRLDTNMVPIRQIQGVTTHRAGMLYAVVKMATAPTR